MAMFKNDIREFLLLRAPEHSPPERERVIGNVAKE